MKIQTLFFFFLWSSIILNGQHVPIDAQDANWGNVDYSCDEGAASPCEYFSYQYKTQGDTIFEGRNYKKLFSGFDLSADLIGFIREDSLKRVYYHPIEPFCPNDSIVEYLLYDYSLDVGDTLELIMPDHEENDPCENPYLNKTTEIIAIDSVMMENGEYRKRFMLGYDDWGLYQHYYIEGIGSSIDLIYILREHSLDGWHVGHSSICYLVGDSIEYVYPSWGEANCGSDFTDNVLEIQKEDRFKVYPNPANDFIIVGSSNEDLLNFDLKIFDVNGRLMKELEGYTGQDISIGFLGKGFYFLKIKSENQAFVSKFLKID